MRRSIPAIWAIVALVAVSSTASVAFAAPTSQIVDRILAVVGRDVVLLSELRVREKPFLLRLDEDAPPEKRAAAE